jgi:hypothetical protein
MWHTWLYSLYKHVFVQTAHQHMAQVLLVLYMCTRPLLQMRCSLVCLHRRRLSPTQSTSEDLLGNTPPVSSRVSAGLYVPRHKHTPQECCLLQNPHQWFAYAACCLACPPWQQQLPACGTLQVEVLRPAGVPRRLACLY